MKKNVFVQGRQPAKRKHSRSTVHARGRIAARRQLHTPFLLTLVDDFPLPPILRASDRRDDFLNDYIPLLKECPEIPKAVGTVLPFPYSRQLMFPSKN